MSRTFGVLLGLVFAATATACFHGADREKDAPPGNLGGLCLAPDGHCDEGVCNQDKNYCFSAKNPCEGFFCGGSERGTCILDQQQQPSCTCNPGFNNETFALYCCPDDPNFDPDPNCVPTGPASDASSG